MTPFWANQAISTRTDGCFLHAMKCKKGVNFKGVFFGISKVDNQERCRHGIIQTKSSRTEYDHGSKDDAGS